MSIFADFLSNLSIFLVSIDPGEPEDKAWTGFTPPKGPTEERGDPGTPQHYRPTQHSPSPAGHGVGIMEGSDVSEQGGKSREEHPGSASQACLATPLNIYSHSKCTGEHGTN